MTAPSPTAALTPEDFDELDAELDFLRERNEETPEWEFCEGFLAALVCMRRELPPQEYWPVLLGEEFRPMEHMEFVWRWRRRWQEIATALDQPVDVLEDERTYHPEAIDYRGAVLALPAEERREGDLGKVPSYAQMWAAGFMEVVETWARPTHSNARSKPSAPNTRCDAAFRSSRAGLEVSLRPQRRAISSRCSLRSVISTRAPAARAA